MASRPMQSRDPCHRRQEASKPSALCMCHGGRSETPIEWGQNRRSQSGFGRRRHVFPSVGEAPRQHGIAWGAGLVLA
eukprot:CAMPEP_0176303928 /NCGR_PEP_ID=MMETSP0121_2-20121125/62163_1 /TAXON_ID=160619 /ORGANISM="Kryptoperidinium foliaceum, Strain CCMP 1326" /LENGTH=76 /DNA_ID=CAMNT_0017645509 /DNA_START=180 /DNA_END=406 /DNA_ORIENTATION=+